MLKQQIKFYIWTSMFLCRFMPLGGAGGVPIPVQTACSIKALVLGSANLLIPEGWIHQSFGFSQQVRFGLVQHKGGPCGVLAAVQAHLIKENFNKLEDAFTGDKQVNMKHGSPTTYLIEQLLM